ncbi:MAG: DUF3800 domain-containing protein [Bacteroidales bacterium]|nr:DUF3800 domain-containing protein [Bacteroidales bacterium]
MHYIYLDESEKNGTYFSNFYGGILIDSQNLKEFNERINKVITLMDLDGEEIKWQKVNAYTFPKYLKIIDELFTILEEGKAKIRLFFRHNKNIAVGLTPLQKHDEYTMLYYQFIKNSFGLTYAPHNKSHKLRIIFDEMPIGQSQKVNFKKCLMALFNTPEMKAHRVSLEWGDIAEVDSKNHLPLQMVDLILGCICFRLNDKHKAKDSVSGKRGRRTILREKIYKHLLNRIRRLTYPNFNIGFSTSINKVSEKWSNPYLHWRFVPIHSIIDESKAKHKI